jgi:hypothetical protein
VDTEEYKSIFVSYVSPMNILGYIPRLIEEHMALYYEEYRAICSSINQGIY